MSVGVVGGQARELDRLETRRQLEIASALSRRNLLIKRQRRRARRENTSTRIRERGHGRGGRGASPVCESLRDLLNLVLCVAVDEVGGDAVLGGGGGDQLCSVRLRFEGCDLRAQFLDGGVLSVDRFRERFELLVVSLRAALPRAGVGLPVLGRVVLLGLLRGLCGVGGRGVLDGRISGGGGGFGRCLRAVRGLLIGGVFGL